ncbi:MAG: hypothetical protein ACPHGY_03160 [Rhodospirillaceae bacterium]
MPDDSVNPESTPLRYSVKGKRMRFFDAQGVDELVAICMGLAQEMWVIKERQAALESVAAEKGVVLPDDVEGHTFTDEQRAALDAEKQGFIDRIFFTLREEAESLVAEPEEEPPAPSLP